MIFITGYETKRAHKPPTFAIEQLNRMPKYIGCQSIQVAKVYRLPFDTRYRQDATQHARCHCVESQGFNINELSYDRPAWWYGWLMTNLAHIIGVRVSNTSRV